MSNLSFQTITKDPSSMARTGRLTVKHGVIETPAFIVVGTKATVKGVDPETLKALGVQVSLGNTYHLMLRPGEEVVRQGGGLHRFMGWDGPMVTDSGGFQAFSLGLAMTHGIGKVYPMFPDEGEKRNGKAKERPFAKITEEGVKFRSHIDGDLHMLTPERSMEIQHALGADMILVLDECTSSLSSDDYIERSLHMSHRWAERCIAVHDTDQALVGILQGGTSERLRRFAARWNAEHPFDAYAIGGNLGRTKQDMFDVIRWCTEGLPDDKPRHLLGIGGVDDIFGAVENGVDMFDCVSPTRLARMGIVFLRPESGGTPKNKWRTHINGAMKVDQQPIDPSCDCPTCARFTRSYIRHLHTANELFGHMLTSQHNIRFMMRLFEEIRAAITNGTYKELKKKWMGE